MRSEVLLDQPLYDRELLPAVGAGKGRAMVTLFQHPIGSGVNAVGGSHPRLPLDATYLAQSAREVQRSPNVAPRRRAAGRAAGAGLSLRRHAAGSGVMGTPRAPAVDVLQLRTRLGLNQSQFADLFGVHAMTVSKWERGELAPDPWRRVMMGRAWRYTERHKEAACITTGYDLARDGAVEVLSRLLLVP